MPVRQITLSLFAICLIGVAARAEPPDENADKGEKLPEGAIARLVCRAKGATKPSSIVSVGFTKSGDEIWTTDGTILTKWDAHLHNLRTQITTQHSQFLVMPDRGWIVGREDIPPPSGSQSAPMKQIVLIDASSGKTIRALGSADFLETEPLAVSQDSQMVLVREHNWQITVWNATNGSLLSTSPKQSVWSRPVFQPDGFSFYYCADNSDALNARIVRRWGVNGAEFRPDIVPDRDPELDKVRGKVKGLAISPDGRRLAVCEDSCQFLIHDVRTGKMLFEKRSPPESYFGIEARIAYSPDGAFLAVANWTSERHVVQLWDARRLQLLRQLQHPGCSQGFHMAFSPDSATLATCCTDCLLWDLNPYRPKQSLVLTETDLQRLWQEIGDPGQAGLAAMADLSDASNTSVELLKSKLRVIMPAVAVDASALIADLDDDAFTSRDNASRELTNLGPAAVEQLRTFVAGNPSPEARARATRILENTGRDYLRCERAIEVLERIGTPEAREILADLAKGDAAAQITKDAEASFKRMSALGK